MRTIAAAVATLRYVTYFVVNRLTPLLRDINCVLPFSNVLFLIFKV